MQAAGFESSLCIGLPHPVTVLFQQGTHAQLPQSVKRPVNALAINCFEVYLHNKDQPTSRYYWLVPMWINNISSDKQSFKAQIGSTLL